MLSIVLLSVCVSATPTVHQRLSEVNAEWKQVSPGGDLLAPARYATERELLHDHLVRVEARLRAVDVSALPEATRAARARTLDNLHRYLTTQECPLNETRATRVPVMIDSEGRHCPVAALMAWDGQDALVREVARSANNILVRDLTDPRFLKWAQGSGLSVDELAAIQPAYTPVTRWHVAVPSSETAPPSSDELKALARVDDGDHELTTRHAVREALEGTGVPTRAVMALDENGATRTAGPVVFEGSTYVAVRTPTEESARYDLRRWAGKRWEHVKSFPVPVNALTEFDGKLFVGGGGHPFDPSEARASSRAFISSFDGTSWTRVPIAARGQVQRFSIVRGQLCAAVTKFVWPT